MIDGQKIKDVGRALHIDDIRITDARPFLEAAQRISTQKNEGLYLRNERWYKRNINQFCDVRSKFPKAKSIISACQCYLTDEELDRSKADNPHGLIARYTWRNHYLDLRVRLNKLAHFIKEICNAKYCVYSNGPISEKPIAQRSGIGYFGKHSIIINKNHGSWIILGEIITDAAIEIDEPLAMECGSCQLCIDACPTKAIIRSYVIDRRICIQALSNWYGVIEPKLAHVWGNRLYGCTVCQDVCPQNKNVKPMKPRTDLGYVGPSLPLLEILHLNESAYRKKYANNQITEGWINFKAIKRNALVALGNIKNSNTLDVLEKFSRDDDVILAQTAHWAISNF